ncbi:hypothetical protein [uncultured Chryseobacterium sp.]|uniref:hypothetical protein n=1 Tax=uncultured Chryseobacterium sp. TaxID=259322 RepID=UPI0025F27BC4|nr:hypothetical protein [uncultured Chryseobacterium sp.]
MKKINLKSVKEKLTRTELKSIMGGSGSSGVNCNITASWCLSGKAYAYNWGTGSGTQLYCCG